MDVDPDLHGRIDHLWGHVRAQPVAQPEHVLALLVDLRLEAGPDNLAHPPARQLCGEATTLMRVESGDPRHPSLVEEP
eukprot:7376523-Prymnesium_polylepis.1